MAESLYEDVVIRRTLSPAVRTNGTVNGVSVDRAGSGGAHSAVAVVYTGTITDGGHAVSVQDSDDGTTFAAVPAAQLQGATPTLTAANGDTVSEVGILFSRRYLRVSVTTTGATNGGTFGAVVVLGDTVHGPAVHT
jgi:hypothetical protein